MYSCLIILCITLCGNGGRLDPVDFIGGVVYWGVEKLDGPVEAFNGCGWLVVRSALAEVGGGYHNFHGFRDSGSQTVLERVGEG
jgi:hypothetical protein